MTRNFGLPDREREKYSSPQSRRLPANVCDDSVRAKSSLRCCCARARDGEGNREIRWIWLMSGLLGSSRRGGGAGSECRVSGKSRAWEEENTEGGKEPCCAVEEGADRFCACGPTKYRLTLMGYAWWIFLMKLAAFFLRCFQFFVYKNVCCVRARERFYVFRITRIVGLFLRAIVTFDIYILQWTVVRRGFVCFVWDLMRIKGMKMNEI